MTDHDPLLDELASAHLDGATSPEEAARVAADPALRARVEELRAVRTAMQSALPSVDPARREAAVAAALATFTDENDRPGTPVPPVTSLAAVAARRRSSPTALRLVGVAAALLLVALLLPRLAGSGDRDDETASERPSAVEDAAGQPAAGDADAGGAEAGDAAQESAAFDESPTTTTGLAAQVDLGSFDELAALVDRAEQRAAGGDFDAADQATVASRADVACGAPAPPGSSTSTAAATLDGEPVQVIVTTDAAGSRTLQIYAAESCTLLLERPL